MKVNKLKLAMIFGAIFILATSITVNQSSPNGEEQITELRHLEDSCFTIGTVSYTPLTSPTTPYV